MSPQILKQALEVLIAECRAHLKEGHIADMGQVERGIRAYCEAVATLPAKEGRLHANDLNALLQTMNQLTGELNIAYDDVKEAIARLGPLKRAHVAYQKSDAIGIKYHPKEDES